MDRTLHYKITVTSRLWIRVKGPADLETRAQTEESTGKLVAQKQTIVSVDRERQDGCAKLSDTSER